MLLNTQVLLSSRVRTAYDLKFPSKRRASSTAPALASSYVFRQGSAVYQPTTPACGIVTNISLELHPQRAAHLHWPPTCRQRRALRRVRATRAVFPFALRPSRGAAVVLPSSTMEIKRRSKSQTTRCRARRVALAPGSRTSAV